MEYAQLRTRMMGLVYDGRAALHTFVDALSPDERAALGTVEHWSAKDVIAHLTSWRLRQIARLTTINSGGDPTFYSTAEQDAINAEAFAQQRDRPWTDVLADEAQTFPQFVTQVERVTEADLTDPQRFPALNGAPLWRHIVLSAYTHPVLHVSEYFLDHGDLSRAIQWQQAAAAALGGFADVPAVAASPHYNLACLFAKAGDLERAIAELRDACTRNPTFVAVARDDPDLVPLHDQTAYQALLAT